jgi:hypothetical protein
VWTKTKNFGLVAHKERREKREKREEREHVEERREETEAQKLVCVTKPKFLVMVYTSVSRLNMLPAPTTNTSTHPPFYWSPDCVAPFYYQLSKALKYDAVVVGTSCILEYGS